MAGLKTDGETLTKELKMAAKIGRNFVFSPASKPEESYIALSKKKIPAAELKTAKKATKKKVYPGSATKQGPVLVFETPLPVSPALTIKLRAAVKAQTAYKGKLEIRQDPVWEEGEFEEAEDGGEDQVPADDPALAKLRRAVDSRLEDALPKATKEVRAQIVKFVKGARKFESDGKLAEAIKCYKTVVGLLGRIGGGGGDRDFAGQWTAAEESWRAASDAVDKQIAALVSVLEKSDDPELKRIAESGLNAVTETDRVHLMAAMHDVDAASGSAIPKAATKAKGIVAEFQSHLQTDVRVKACDANPFGVSVSAQKILGAALTKLDRALDMALSP